MHYVHVAYGVVDQRAVFDDPMPTDWQDFANWFQNEDAQIGWTCTGGVFAAPVPPAPTLEQAQTSKLAALRMSCNAAIIGGFPSSALGSAHTHTYPTDTTSQSNLIASVTSSLLPSLPSNWTTPFWCTADGTTWSFVDHTVAQIQQVGIDIKTAVVAAQLKLATLSANVAAATTVDAVNAITW